MPDAERLAPWLCGRCKLFRPEPPNSRQTLAKGIAQKEKFP